MLANWFRFSYALGRKDIDKVGFLFSDKMKVKIINHIEKPNNNLANILYSLFKVYYNVGVKYASDKDVYITIENKFKNNIIQKGNIRIFKGDINLVFILENDAWRLDDIGIDRNASISK